MWSRKAPSSPRRGAFGDHLHFGILVGGVEVTPLEWLDPKWIKDNITGRLNAQ